MSINDVGRKILSLVGWSIVLFMVVFIFLDLISGVLPFFTVAPYETAVVVRLGNVHKVAGPGFHIRAPILDKVRRYDLRLKTYETSDYPDKSKADYTDYPVDTTTSDGQPIRIKYTVRFKIKRDHVEWIYKNIGTHADIVEKIIKADSRVNVRVIARNYKAEQLYAGDVKAFEEQVASVLEQSFADKGIVLDMFGVRGIDFSDEYVNAVEQKQIEKERVIAEKYKAEQEEYRKQQRITQAQAEAEAQRILQQSLTDKILTKMWIEKWDGKLPQIVTGDNATQFLMQLPDNLNNK